jgi:GNAT superfamily N-acetyltransferase
MNEMSRARIPLATIRLCREADLSPLEWFGAFTHHRQLIREAFALQQSGDVVMLVAEVDGFAVGQAWLDLRPAARGLGPKVWAMRVLESLRGRGIGAQLLAALEEIAREGGYACLEVGVEKNNPAARQFYERHGWRVLGHRLDSYSYVPPSGTRAVVPLDEWVLLKELSREGAARPTRL